MKVEIKDAAFGYKKYNLFEHLNVVVPAQSVLTILGPNGVGKTTLLRCMMGFLPWREGATYFNDKPLSSYSHRELWSHMSYVPQAKQSPFGYSVLDTVVMGLNATAGVFSTPSKDDYEKALETLDWLGISDIARSNCNEISGGQLQMTLIARALVSKPEVLILDEPESNLDMRNQLLVMDAIKRVTASRSTTCIINTHFPEHAFMVSDNTLFVGHENVRLHGETLTVINEENIRRFYGVNARIVDVSVADATREEAPHVQSETPDAEDVRVGAASEKHAVLDDANNVHESNGCAGEGKSVEHSSCAAAASVGAGNTHTHERCVFPYALAQS